MKKITVPYIQKEKNRHKTVMITAYDAQMARIVDAAGVDIILVGDSLGTVVLGYTDTINVTIEDMVHHVKAVSRGASRALIVGDMPFGSAQIGGETARRDAVSLMRAGAEAVKLEGAYRLELVHELVRSGIPVMGHLGLTPQSIHAFGGHKVQGRGNDAEDALVHAAKELENAGVFSIVIECVPESTAEAVTQSVNIPTIGIGAGVKVDGQVLVLNDLLNLDPSFKPRYVKHYADGSEYITAAVKAYIREVRDGVFPDKSHTYGDSKR